jgi:peptide/nickel transport system substrate-binding protein
MARYPRRRIGASLCAVCAAVLVAAASSAGGASAKPSRAVKPTKPFTIIGGFGSSLQPDFNPFDEPENTETGGTSLLYLPLAAYNSLNSTYTDYLATGVKIVSPREVVFTLRKGVRWSNGQPVTPADVKFSFELLKKYPTLDTTSIWQYLRSVSTTRSKVIFKLTSPNSQIAPVLAVIPVVPPSAWASVDPVTFTNSSPKVVDGPYRLGSVSSIKAVYTKNRKYYAASTMTEAPDTVEALPQVPGATQILQMEQGVFDINQVNDFDRGGFRTDWVDKDRATNKFWAVPGDATLTMYMNLTEAPFNNPTFRQALSYGIDRSAASRAANVNGYEPPAAQTGLTSVNSNLLPSSIPHHGMVAYSPAKARALFKRAGYRYSGGKLIGPNGQPVTFTLNTVQGFVDWLGAANTVVSDMASLGITVDLQQVQAPSAIGDLASGQFQTALWFGDLNGSPFYDLNNMLAGSLTAPVGKPAAGDYGRFNSARVNTLLHDVAAAPSTLRQDLDLGRVASIVYNQAPTIQLLDEDLTIAYSTRSYTGYPDAADPYASYTSVDSYLQVIPELKAVK